MGCAESTSFLKGRSGWYTVSTITHSERFSTGDQSIFFYWFLECHFCGYPQNQTWHATVLKAWCCAPFSYSFILSLEMFYLHPWLQLLSLFSLLYIQLTHLSSEYLSLIISKNKLIFPSRPNILSLSHYSIMALPSIWNVRNMEVLGQILTFINHILSTSESCPFCLSTTSLMYLRFFPFFYLYHHKHPCLSTITSLLHYCNSLLNDLHPLVLHSNHYSP